MLRSSQEDVDDKSRDKTITKYRKECLRVLMDLVASYIVKGAPTCGPGQEGEGEVEGEEENGGEEQERSKKRRKIHIDPDNKEVVELVRRASKTFEPGSVWVVNWRFLDDRLKSEKVGQHIYECTEIEGCQEIITAALFYCANKGESGEYIRDFNFKEKVSGVAASRYETSCQECLTYCISNSSPRSS